MTTTNYWVRGGVQPPPQKIMHFGAKFLLGFTMHSVNRGGAAPPLESATDGGVFRTSWGLG